MNLHSTSSRAICILGMHRSGTSVAARALKLAGVYLGPEAAMMPPTPDNAAGYWEHLEIYRLHQRLLAQWGRCWVMTGPLPRRWIRSRKAEPFRRELRDLIIKNFAGQVLWGWKEPCTCLLLPLWRDALGSAGTKLTCLFMVRDPLEVAASLFKRDGLAFQRGLRLWFYYNAMALRDAEGLPIIFLHYDRLLTDGEAEMRRCLAGLGLGWPQNDAHGQALLASIQPDLRHHQSVPQGDWDMPGEVRELNAILRELSDSPEPRKDHASEVRRLTDNFLFPGSLQRLWRGWKRPRTRA